jgi:beta-lactamase regulating signal transducer with metallopeptidase domain
MIKVSVILLLGLGSCALLRRRSAALRHLVLTTAIIGASIAPAVHWLFPAWDMRAVAAAATSLTAEAPQHSLGAQQRAPNITGRKHHFWEGLQKKMDWSALSWIWLGGTGTGLLLLVTGLARVRWLVRQAEAVETGPLHEQLTTLALQLGVRRIPRLYLASEPPLLITYGVLQPRIILPAQARAWSRERLSVVLLHELSHVARADWLGQLLGQAFRAVWWFNPFAWMAVRRLREESERACDEEVLRRGTPAADYATHLLDIARTTAASRLTITPAPAMVRTSGLEKRVVALLRFPVEGTGESVRTRRAVAACILMATFLVGTFGVSAQSLARFSGRVLDRSQAGVASATVTLREVDSGDVFEVETDATGRFEFGRVPFGDYILEAKAPDVPLSRDSVRLNGRDLTRDLRLDAAR